MSDFNNNSDNQEFIKKLELLRDLEAEKPVEEMDVSLVMACVDLILELRGETVNFTPEEVEEKVRKIPFVEETTTLNTPPKSVKGRSTKVKSRKILLIAAIISILIAIFAVTSIAFDWNIFDELKNRFGTVADTPVNQEINANGITVVSRGKNKVTNSIEEALKSECVDILFPDKLPNDMIVEQIIFDQVNGNERVSFKFNNTLFSYRVVFRENISDDVKAVSTEILNIHEFDCCVIDMPDLNLVQVYFEYNNDLYMLSCDSKQVLIEVIENLRSYNEN